MEFTFYNPTKIIFGNGRIAEIGAELKASGARKVLFVAGRGSIKKNGVYEQVADSLRSNGLQWAEAWGVQPNPTLAKVKEIIAVARKEQVDAVLAVGGGSVIDTAKVVTAGFYAEDVWGFFEGKEGVNYRPMNWSACNCPPCGCNSSGVTPASQFSWPAFGGLTVSLPNSDIPSMAMFLAAFRSA